MKNISFILLLFFAGSELAAQNYSNGIQPLYRKEIAPDGTIFFHMSRSTLLGFGKLSAFYFDASDTTKHDIASYNISIFGKGLDPIVDIPNMGDAFSQTLIDYFKKSRIGQLIHFEYITENTSDKSTRRLQGITVIISK